MGGLTPDRAAFSASVKIGRPLRHDSRGLETGWTSSPHLGSLTLVAIAAVCHAVALEPSGLWPLAWIASAPLALATLRLTPRRACVAGLLFGSLAALMVAPWLPRLMMDYFVLSAPWSFLAAAAVWMLTAGPHYAALALWLAWAGQRGPVSPFLVGAAWGLMEWVRTHALLANPWGLLSAAQLPWLPGAQGLDLIGPYGLSMAMATTGAMLAGLLDARLGGARPWTQRIAVMAMIGLLLAYGSIRLRDDLGGVPMPITLVQGAVPRAERWEPLAAAANLERYIELSAHGTTQRPVLIFWPELAMEFYAEGDDARSRRKLMRVARDGVSLLAGGLGVTRLPSDGTPVPTNAVLLVESGALRARYDKVQLIPFAERAPLGLNRVLGEGFFPGSSPAPLPTDVGPVGILLCSEVLDPSLARARIAAGAGLLANPANDDWFGSRGAARQALAAARSRAIETRRWVVRPTTTGFTAVIDPFGRIVAEAPRGEPATLSAEVRFIDGTSLYVRMGEWPVVVAAFALLADGARRWRS